MFYPAWISHTQEAGWHMMADQRAGYIRARFAEEAARSTTTSPFALDVAPGDVESVQLSRSREKIPQNWLLRLLRQSPKHADFLQAQLRNSATEHARLRALCTDTQLLDHLPNLNLAQTESVTSDALMTLLHSFLLEGATLVLGPAEEPVAHTPTTPPPKDSITEIRVSSQRVRLLIEAAAPPESSDKWRYVYGQIEACSEPEWREARPYLEQLLPQWDLAARPAPRRRVMQFEHWAKNDRSMGSPEYPQGIHFMDIPRLDLGKSVHPVASDEGDELLHVRSFLSQFEATHEQLADALSSMVGVRELLWHTSGVIDLQPLSNLLQLTLLDLRHNPLQDVTPLSYLKRLEKLDLSHTRVSDLRALQGLTSLHVLGLNNTPIASAESIGRLRALRRLDIGRTKINNIEALSQLQHLEHLVLASTSIRDLSPLRTLTKLRLLDIRGIHDIRLAPIQTLIKHGLRLKW